MAVIDSKRMRFFLEAAQAARTAWEAARDAQLATDRHDRCAWTQAQAQTEQAFAAYNDKARDVTTVLQLLIEQAEHTEKIPARSALVVGRQVQGHPVVRSCGYGVKLPRDDERLQSLQCLHLQSPQQGDGPLTVSYL